MLPLPELKVSWHFGPAENDSLCSSSITVVFLETVYLSI